MNLWDFLASEGGIGYFLVVEVSVLFAALGVFLVWDAKRTARQAKDTEEFIKRGFKEKDGK